jgi:hypothetical protein
MICIDYLLFIFEIKVIEIGDWMILEKTIMLIYLS